MGMFDEVLVRQPLPDGWVPPKEERFQTKDLDNDLTCYTLTEDGRLLFDEYAVNLVPPAERPYPEATGLLGLVGALRHTLERSGVERRHEGWLRFYTVDAERQFREYAGWFVGGRLERLVMAHEAPPEDLVGSRTIEW